MLVFVLLLYVLEELVSPTHCLVANYNTTPPSKIDINYIYNYPAHVVPTVSINSMVEAACNFYI